MTKVPKYWSKAKKYLSKKDKIISKLIKNYENPSETILTSRQDIFFSLCKSIIGQQISVAAANSVFFKFKKKCNGKINAKIVSKLSSSQLKSCGLSRQKALGIKNLSKQILNRSFNSEYYDLIEGFYKKTGIPAIVNTSLNLHGKPLVYNLKQALYTFKNSDLDYLILNYSYIISKN